MRKLDAEMMAYLLKGAESDLDPLQPSSVTFESGVIRHRNITYCAGKKRDAVRHLLDLYLPAKVDWLGTRPLIIFVHGGGWRIGSKDDLSGLYGRTAQAFAKRGVAVANINYRLSPRVTHPSHIQDVAAAFAFLHTNAPDYGYNQNAIFLMGHSAGAHLAALLALNPIFLADEIHITVPDPISGVIAISGSYDLTALAKVQPAQLKKVENTDTVLGRVSSAFAPRDCHDASPILHVTQHAPPFLLIHEEVGTKNIKETQRFAEALDRQKVTNSMLEMPSTNHISMLIELARKPALGIDHILKFIETHG